MNMFVEHGDAMAKQYGGSQAMHRAAVDGEKKDLVLAGGVRNAMVAVRRYYSNNFTDTEKQHAINLFLGIFCPALGRKHIWEYTPDPTNPNFSYDCESWSLVSQANLVDRLSFSPPVQMSTVTLNVYSLYKSD